ncbi:MAG: cytochrome c oxidase assembly factor Coa1 family protein [Planctomycetota bacterium]|jgi:hypothetical protein
MHETQPKSWWGRNWKWVVPTGVITTLAAGGGLVTIIISLALGLIKGSGAYTEAVARARTEPAVTAALGTPIEEGFLVVGDIEESNASGSADLAIPISGPNGSATIFAVAEKEGGHWQFSTLEVAVEEGNERVDLLSRP